MSTASSIDQDMESNLEALADRLVSQWSVRSGTRLPKAPGLLLYNPAAAAPEAEALESICGAPLIRIASGAAPVGMEWGGLTVARTSGDSLPLQSHSFGLVILSHVIGAGKEPVLEEGCRLLIPGGRLVILGLNRLGLRYHTQGSDKTLPGIRAISLRAQLEALDMEVRVMHAAGFLRGDRPGDMSRGLARLLVPLADLLLIVAKPAEPRIMSPIVKTKLRTVGAPSAIAGP